MTSGYSIGPHTGLDKKGIFFNETNGKLKEHVANATWWLQVSSGFLEEVDLTQNQVRGYSMESRRERRHFWSRICLIRNTEGKMHSRYPMADGSGRRPKVTAGGHTCEVRPHREQEIPKWSRSGVGWMEIPKLVGMLCLKGQEALLKVAWR